jgi:hypothetical protein
MLSRTTAFLAIGCADQRAYVPGTNPLAFAATLLDPNESMPVGSAASWLVKERMPDGIHRG